MKKGSVLVLGAGNSRIQRLHVTGDQDPAGPNFDDNFEKVVTLDIDEACKPDILWNLEDFPWPVEAGSFDEVHAYEVLEHIGGMGDYKFFFSLWKEIWRVLKSGGLVCASTPWWESVWAWQDPGHRNVYSREKLIYLNQGEYVKQIGSTAMTDYRRVYPPPFSFVPLHAQMQGDNPKLGGFLFVLQKEEFNG